MRLTAYREYDLCGDEYLAEEHNCPIALQLDADDSIMVIYHPGRVDEEILEIVRASNDPHHVFLTCQRKYGPGSDERYHVSMAEWMVFTSRCRRF